MVSDHVTQARMASGANALIGIWLIFSPLIYIFTPATLTSTWNGVLAGALIAIFGAVRATYPRQHPGLSWINLVLGTWTAMSPWLFGYLSGIQMWNSLFAGLAVIALAVCSGSATYAYQRQMQS